MFNHAPPGYHCPFCHLLSGGDTDANAQEDIVRRSTLATALISPRWWPNNRGHALVIPNGHYEHLYELPDAYGHAVHDLVRQIAIAMRTTYGCDGISTRQHNEPAGNQDVWHYHVHVFPRYVDDNLYASRPCPKFTTPEQRRPYVDRLRRYFEAPAQHG